MLIEKILPASISNSLVIQFYPFFSHTIVKSIKPKSATRSLFTRGKEYVAASKYFCHLNGGIKSIVKQPIEKPLGFETARIKDNFILCLKILVSDLEVPDVGRFPLFMFLLLNK